jgi:tetratricopeptide (TPR) repeat protein
MFRGFLTLFLFLTLTLPVQAEIQTITQTIRQPFGGSQSADDARIAAVAKAKREALEQAGTYVEALTIVKDSRLDKDEILAVTAGVCQSEVIATKNYHTDDAFGIEVNVKVLVDTSVLGDRVKKLLADRTHLGQLNAARKKEKELLDKIASLEIENKNLKATPEEKKQLTADFRKASQGLTAVEWWAKAAALGDSADVQQTVISYLDEAIRLKPDYAEALNNRGVAYSKIGKYALAIEDYNKLLQLKPDDADFYCNRAGTYIYLGQYSKSIEDSNRAMKLKPDYANAYVIRGIAYEFSGRLARGCRDLRKACDLGNCEALAIAVNKRGHCSKYSVRTAIRK